MKIITTFLSVLIAGTFSLTKAQEHIPSADELLQSVSQLNNFSGLANFNTSSVKTDDYVKLLKEKCEKNGGPDAFENAKLGPPAFATCIQSLVNVTELKIEMDEAKPRGELDTVFKKYCRRIPTLKKCVRNVTDSIEPCLEAEERDNIKIIHNITSSLLEFICHNEGDRIAMFIAAGGVDCFKAKQAAVMECANQTFTSFIPAGNTAGSAPPAITSLPLLVLGMKECTGIENFQQCTVEVLEQCEDPTSANVVESLIRFIKRATPCQNLLGARASAATGDSSNAKGSSGITSAVNILLITISMKISLQFV